MTKILIIEDNETMRDAMTAIIGKMEHEVDSAKNGHDGLHLMEKNTYDLVVSDYKMEGMDGLEVLKQVKQKYPSTEVLIITAYGTIELAVEAMKLGASDYIVKSNQEYKKLPSIVKKMKH